MVATTPTAPSPSAAAPTTNFLRLNAGSVTLAAAFAPLNPPGAETVGAALPRLRDGERLVREGCWS